MTAALLYIHGFLSSPDSQKAQQLKQFLANDFPGVQLDIPALPNTPGDSLKLLDERVQALLNEPGCRLGLVGSSLGGFFATVLAERYRLPAVLINPAVRPTDLAAHFLGTHTNPYSQQTFTIDEDDIATIRAMEPSDNLHSRYWVLMQTGDEVLDYRRAEAFYQGQTLTIEEGGDHHFQNFERHMGAVVEFLGLSG
ncbi:esterase YqiA [Spongiibacter sp. KMU-158]|uniref:Esterase YqiA n=1 Tax=Spongiibacter pelagi TaxID=2760804 RepID=A0A927BXR3_9GAMM|nr:YqiA/YcfP family alpha/beta fold hydrolase [Spongiibacter pelagi]MBD2857489.1 esterase YqiA [Spongiibacter pelagi]